MNTKERARRFAIVAHGDQKWGQLPYIEHLDRVAAIAEKYESALAKVTSPPPLDHVQAVAYLHDVLEDTTATHGDLVEFFNEKIASDVFCMTDEPGKNRAERKKNTYPKIRQSLVSTYIKLCDRLVNLQFAHESKSAWAMDMYQAEHPLFEAALWHPGQFEELWAEINKLALKTFSKP